MSNKNMKWQYKAILQDLFSNLPFGTNINYLFQKKLTKSFPIKESKLQEKSSIAKKHIQNFLSYGKSPLEKAIFYEFGAGRDLVQPLIYWTLGVNSQIIVDIRKLIQLELIKDSIEKVKILNSILEIKRIPEYSPFGESELTTSLKKFYGIEYHAPSDARSTGLNQNSVDCITSTNTLEHIPPEDIRAILKECHRILKDNGILSFQIDYQDHYSYFDKSISVYNFLQFSEQYWNLFFNPSLHYQNRLRHKDYLKIINDTGFEILSDKTVKGTLADIETIKTLSLDKKFLDYSFSELAIRGTLIVLKKKNVNI